MDIIEVVKLPIGVDLCETALEEELEVLTSNCPYSRPLTLLVGLPNALIAARLAEKFTIERVIVLPCWFISNTNNWLLVSQVEAIGCGFNE